MDNLLLIRKKKKKKHYHVSNKGKTLRKNQEKKCALQHNTKTCKGFSCVNSAYFV